MVWAWLNNYHTGSLTAVVRIGGWNHPNTQFLDFCCLDWGNPNGVLCISHFYVPSPHVLQSTHVSVYIVFSHRDQGHQDMSQDSRSQADAVLWVIQPQKSGGIDSPIFYLLGAITEAFSVSRFWKSM